MAGGAISVRCNGKSGFNYKCYTIIASSKFKNNSAEMNGGGIHFRLTASSFIQNSIFEGNSASYSGGSIAILKVKDKKETSSVSNCKFLNNKARIGGALCFDARGSFRSKHSVEASQFWNNSATSLGQSIYANVHIMMNGVRVGGSDQYSKVYHVHTENANTTIYKTFMTLARRKGSEPKASINGFFIQSVNITIFDGFIYKCPANFRTDVENSSYVDEPIPYTVFTYLVLQCKACPYNQYTLDRGSFYMVDIFTQPQISQPRCMKCPSGGNCEAAVRSVDNYWGYKKSAEELAFKLCPLGYCCSAEATACVDSQTCVTGRSGVLCGTCAEGYKQGFLSGSCIAKDGECSEDIFIFYVVVYSIAYTLLFVFITSISDVVMLVKLGVTTRRAQRAEATELDEEVSVVVIKDSFKEDSAEDNSDGEPSLGVDTFSLSGFVQIIILYFQVASLLRVKYQKPGRNMNATASAQTGSGSSTEAVREVFAIIFNFRSTFIQGLCPSDTLTLPEKEGILFGMKMCTFLVLVILFLLTRLGCCYKSGDDTGVEASDSLFRGEKQLDTAALDTITVSATLAEHTEGTTEMLTFPNRLKYTFIKLIKMYYTPTAKVTLQMLHCVNINDSYHLFVYGDHVCYSNWQIAVGIIILPGILLFPTCFEIALRLMKNKQISSGQFTIALFCPYYALFLYLSDRIISSRSEKVPSQEEKTMIRKILQAEEELYAQQEGVIEMALYLVVPLTLPTWKIWAHLRAKKCDKKNI